MAAGGYELLSSTAKQSPIGSEQILHVFSYVAALAALIPIARAFHFVMSAGIDVPSNDDVIFFDIIERMGRGDYHWQNYFTDTLINGHSFAVGLALFWLNACMTGANQLVMIGAALLILCGRLLLMNDYLFGNFSRRTQMILLPVLSLLLFAPSQTAILTHGTFALTWQLSLFANVFSLWIMAKWKDSNLAKASSAGSAIVGCWTGATSLPVLPLLFLQNYLNGLRRPKEFLWIVAACALSLAPYLAAFAVPRSNSRSIAAQIVGFNATTLLNILGRPFSNGIGYTFGHIQQSQNAGIFGLTALAVLLLLAWKHTDLKEKQAFFIPSSLLTALGLTSCALVTSVRPFIAPTNCSLSSIFWCGISAMSVYCLCFARKNSLLAKLCSSLILSTILISTIVYSRKFEDKQYYLDNRAPFSASFLRNYSHAPTYATRMLFKLINMPPYALALPLEKHSWSIFAPHRQYYLQGDFALANVELQRSIGGRIFWVKDAETKPTSWKTYAHLNLALQGASTVYWRLKIPDQCKRALLHCPIVRKSDQNDSLSSLIYIKHRSNAGYPVGELETPQGIDLSKFSGQTITICFHHTSPGICILQFPTLEVVAPPDPQQFGLKYAPENVHDTNSLQNCPHDALKKIDDQHMSIRPKRPITCQEFQSLEFLTTGRPGLINCIVRYKSGESVCFEIPVLGSGKPAVYSQPGRIFDDSPEQIEEISLVNNSQGVLSDYVVSGCLRCSE